MAAFEEVAEEDVVRRMVLNGNSHQEISIYYQNIYPNQRGLSARSVRRYRRIHNIARLTTIELQDLVRENIRLYGHTYGRRMLQGSIRACLGVTHGAVNR